MNSSIEGADFGKTYWQPVRTSGTYPMVRTLGTVVLLELILASKGCFCASKHAENRYVRFDDKNLVKEIPILTSLFLLYSQLLIRATFCYY